jgi:hypothetical protein
MVEKDSVVIVYICSLSVFITTKCIYTNNITITAYFIVELKLSQM